MQNHYKILGITNSATEQEIRRAYRILARRYHPDLSDDPSASEKFKIITEAYETLSDPGKRAHHDLEIRNQLGRAQGAKLKGYAGSERGSSATERFHRAQRRPPRDEPPPTEPVAAPPQPAPFSALFSSLKDLWRSSRDAVRSQVQERATSKVTKVSIIEASISVRDAIVGVKKTVEVEEPQGVRKISVSIPPGVRSGSVVRLRAKGDSGEELILIVRVASHPFISMQPRGIVIEIPVTFQEALYGASISVPTLDDPVSIKIPAGSHSGFEVRVRERGITPREGPRGDLFYRIMIQTPESPEAVGLREKVAAIEAYYGSRVRLGLPSSLLDE